MNENIFKGKWKEIKGEIVRSWGKITEDELEQTKGDLTKISGIVQQKYGETQESVRERLNAFTTADGWEGPNELLLTAGRRP